MTISNTTVRQLFTGDGVVTTFAIPFQCQDNDEVLVILRDANDVETTQVISTNYSITGGDPGTNVVMNVAPAVGEFLLVRRSTANTQLADYDDNLPFPAASHERALDKLEQQIQELREQLSRCLQFPPSGSNVNVFIEELTPNKYLLVDSGGDNIIMGEGGSGGGGGSAIPTVFGSSSNPRDITGSVGLRSSNGDMNTTDFDQIIFVAGVSAGLTDLTANPQVEAHTEVGAKIRFIGRSDTAPIKFNEGTGLKLNGQCVLHANEILELIWDGTDYLEASRSVG